MSGLVYGSLEPLTLPIAGSVSIERKSMYYLKLIRSYFRASVQDEIAHRSNFWISFLITGLNLLTGVLGIAVLFGQVDSINGWDFASTLTILGVYLTVQATRGLFIGPSLDVLAGMDGEVWTGKLDFTVLRPVDVQFQASFRHWRPFRLVDLALGLGVLIFSRLRLENNLELTEVLTFLSAMLVVMLILYAILLIFAGLVFWNPGFLFTWVFDGIFQMARYPLGVYPEWVRLILTWIIPVGLITTVPAQALMGQLPLRLFSVTLLVAVALLISGTAVFRIGLRRYASASS
jgi:ABC-2 type transport system permease protein